MSSYFGHTTVESTYGTSSNYAQAFKATLSQAGTVTSIDVSIYLGDGLTDGLKVALYDHDAANDRPGSLLGYGTKALTGLINGWVSVSISPIKIAAGTYWLAFKFQSGNANFRYISTGGRQAYKSSTYSNAWPNPFGAASFNTSNASIRGAYTPNAAPGQPTSLSATTNNLTPTFTGAINDSNGDDLGAVEIVVTRVSDGATMWDSGKVSASGTTFNVVYAGSALSWSVAYQWKARTWDEWDAAGAYSALQNLTLVHKPNVPSSLSPTGRITTLTPTFQGQFTDSDPTHTFSNYQIILYAADQTTVVWDSGTLAGSGSSFSKLYNGPALTWGTQYYWKAHVQCSDAQWSDYSALQALKTNSYPTQPTAMSPTNGSVITTLTPRFSATFNDPDVGDSPIALYVQILRVSDSVSVLDTGWLSTTNQYYDVGAAVLSLNVWYKWRIRYRDTGSLDGAWSDWVTFKASSGPTVSVDWPLQYREDTFTRADNASSLGSSEHGAASEAWNARVGTWGISSNKAYTSVSTANALATLSGYANGVTQADVTFATGITCGVVFRLQDTNNYWRAALDAGGLKLYKQVAGVWTQVGSTYAFSPVNGQAYTIKITHDGTSITVNLDGTDQITVTGQTDLQTASSVGLYCNSSAAVRFDNFLHQAARLESPVQTMTWTYYHAGSVAQASYRLTIYASDQATIVYDSGLLYGAATSQAVPVGYLQNGNTYYVEVTVTDADGLSATSGKLLVTTSWTPPPDITGVAVVANNASGRLDVTWSVSTLDPADFLRYNIYCSHDSGATWTLVAQVTNQQTTAYSYYDAAHGEETAIAVTQSKVYYGTELESSRVSDADTLTLDGTWLNEANNPGQFYAKVRYRPSDDFAPVLDEVESLPMGRSGPVFDVGLNADDEPICYETFSGSWLVISDSEHTADEWFAMLKALHRRASVCIYRDVRGQRLYVRWRLKYSYVLPGLYDVSIEATQTDYTPPVEVLP